VRFVSIDILRRNWPQFLAAGPENPKLPHYVRRMCRPRVPPAKPMYDDDGHSRRAPREAGSEHP